MRNPKISVAIPVFNCEKYIHQCAKSLMEQTFDNIEYIFINDASTDNSLAILNDAINDYPHRIEQVKIIDLPQNGGSSNARRIAIDAMTGDYFIFCDGDDWVEKNYFSEMLCEAQRTKAEIICTSFFINTPTTEKTNLFKKTEFCSLNNIPLDVLHFSLCNKLISKNLYETHNIRPFEGVNCWEDLSVLARLFALTNKIAILNKPFYHYRKENNNNTLTTSGQKRILKDHLVCASKLDQWFREQNLDKQYHDFLLFLKFTAKIKMLRGREKNIALWKETYPETNAHILSYANLPIQYKALFFIVNILPTPLTQFIANRCRIFYK